MGDNAEGGGIGHYQESTTDKCSPVTSVYEGGEINRHTYLI